MSDPCQNPTSKEWFAATRVCENFEKIEIVDGLNRLYFANHFDQQHLQCLVDSLASGDHLYYCTPQLCVLAKAVTDIDNFCIVDNTYSLRFKQWYESLPNVCNCVNLQRNVLYATFCIGGDRVCYASHLHPPHLQFLVEQLTGTVNYFYYHTKELKLRVNLVGLIPPYGVASVEDFTHSEGFDQWFDSLS